MRFPELLAKSWDSSTCLGTPEYAKLVPHLLAVAEAGSAIVEVVGDEILEQVSLAADVWKPRLRAVIQVACLVHDIGKANESFQNMVRGELDPRRQPARHELLSAILLCDSGNRIHRWAVEILKVVDADAEALLNCVIGAVAGHHLKLDENWKKAALSLQGGCGDELRMTLSHPDLRQLFETPLPSEPEGEIRYSLIAGVPGSFGSLLLPFNLKSNRWREKIKHEPSWWRFAAVAKALVMAADVAGSAMLPEAQEIRKWVRVTLSKRVTDTGMRDVVDARLKGKQPRPFQSAIGASSARVTLVEAGCGSGKTAAAYLWAARHAQGRKLFFCYPTTGTATEGFLGYVHETDLEAKLIHSRAMVDLEGIANVADDDENDHLLRIESLNAWSPQVVICTADTVLALVRNNRRGLYNSPAILCGAFVFDELHAFDDRMLAAVVAFIEALPGASFLLMTASLPMARKDFLLRTVAGIGEVAPPSDLEAITRYCFRRIAREEDAYEIAHQAVTSKRRVLWICNTVARAQGVFAKLGRAALTYHSRFKYADRVERHRQIIATFGSDTATGIVAVTTQVAEMSLDLDADVLISEIAPIPALIQRLGRLNRRVTPKDPGTARTAVFYAPQSALPYGDEDLALANRWVDELMSPECPLCQATLSNEFSVTDSRRRTNHWAGLCQAALSSHFNALSQRGEIELDTRVGWLDSGWNAVPETIREPGCSVSVILPEDRKSCEQNSAELILSAIPMNYDARMKEWSEYRGHFLAPTGVIAYDAMRGAVWE